MHLMSFYAVPYFSRRSDQGGTNRLNAIRGSWFGAGLALGLVAMYLLHDGPRRDGDVLSKTDRAQMAASQAQASRNSAMAGLDGRQQFGKKESIALSQPPTASEATDQAAKAAEREVEVLVRSGDTLIDILKRQGIAHVPAHRIANAVDEVFDLRRLRPGDTLHMTLQEDTKARGEATKPGVVPSVLKRMEMDVSSSKKLVLTSQEGDGRLEYKAKQVQKKLSTEAVRMRSVISDSLYMTALDEDVPTPIINQLILNYSHDIDYQRDIKVGDELELVYEVKKAPDGTVAGSGDIIYAKLVTGGEDYEHYRFIEDSGRVSYYHPDGTSIVNKLLRTPINGARLSSGYGMRRHPVLGYNRMHEGLDFAAPTGTPIYAAGDGVVTFSGRNGGYGNMVVIKHNAIYSTAYAHAHRIPSHIRKGSRVRQGDTVALVGSTGSSTGPHLHYEIRKYGEQVNPSHVKFAGLRELKGAKLTKFKRYLEHVHQRIAKLPVSGGDKQEKVAMAGESGNPVR